MFDFLSRNALYIVLLVTLAVWAGIYVYLLRIERKVRALEHRGDEK